MDVGVGVDAGEDKGQDAHHQERVRDRPDYPERHIPVTNPEILEHQILQKEKNIAVPHRDPFDADRRYSTCKPVVAPLASDHNGGCTRRCR